MSDTLLLPYGKLIETGELVHVSDVPRGRECGCICPLCSTGLIARKGNARVHHFAHEVKTDCKFAAETAIHLAAKELLQSEGYINVPPYALSLSDKIDLYLRNPEIIRTDRQIVNEQVIHFDEVKLEHHCHDIVPDVLVTVGGYDLIIEIHVTHKVDKEKLHKIRKIEIPALEIHIDNHLIYDKEEFREQIIQEINNKKWLYHPRQVKVEQEHQAKIDAFKAKYASNRNRRIRDFKPSPRRRQRVDVKMDPAKSFAYRVEKAGIAFEKQYGRWPTNSEFEEICNRIKRAIGFKE